MTAAEKGMNAVAAAVEELKHIMSLPAEVLDQIISELARTGHLKSLADTTRFFRARSWPYLYRDIRIGPKTEIRQEYLTWAHRLQVDEYTKERQLTELLGLLPRMQHLEHLHWGGLLPTNSLAIFAMAPRLKDVSLVGTFRPKCLAHGDRSVLPGDRDTSRHPHTRSLHLL